MNQIGRILKNRYELITEIGKGGMSTVYLAKDMHLDSYWAVKQVRNNTSIDVDRFKKEVELLSSLNHSDIPRIVDRIETRDYYFVIMDFIDGTSLGKKILADGPIAEKDVVEYARMLCDVLYYLHTAKENPIIYRDMKPDNIMLTQAGRTKLVDFGIAKECRRDEIQTEHFGTKGYAAPEQYKGGSGILDERTDIYALGATMFYLLTGVTPGKPPKGVKPLRRINSLLSEGIEYIISKCTDDDPEWRYQDCLELKEDLENIDKLNSAYRRSMYRKLASFASSAVALLICVVITFSGFSGNKREREDSFQYYYKLAADAQFKGDYKTAAENYADAITYKPDDLETCLLYFNSMLPHNEDDKYETTQITKNAIDVMRTVYINNEQSPMFQNDELMYEVGKQCVSVNDPTYASYAMDYFSLLSDRNYDSKDLASLEIMATMCAQNINSIDFEQLEEALLSLEELMDSSDIPANDKAQNYYTILTIYAAYPNNINNAYQKIASVGDKAKAVIDKNILSVNFTFNNIIPMYKMIASTLYNYATELEANDMEALEIKHEQYSLSLTWFGILEDLYADLSETLWLKKAGAYKGIFDVYNDVSYQENNEDEISKNLNSAIDEYNKLLEQYDSSFLARVQLASCYIKLESIKQDTSQRDYSKAKELYLEIEEIHSSKNNDLSISELAQYSALKENIINLGIIEG